MRSLAPAKKRRICSPIYHFTLVCITTARIVQHRKCFLCTYLYAKKESFWNLQQNGRQAGFYQKVFCKKITGSRNSLKEISGVVEHAWPVPFKIMLFPHIFSLHTNKYTPHFRFTYLKYSKNWQPIGSLLCIASLRLPWKKFPIITYIIAA